MKFAHFLPLVAAAMISLPACAQQDAKSANKATKATNTSADKNQSVEARLKQDLAERVPEMPVEKISKSPVKGIYEVIAGRQIYYVDESGSYFFSGDLIDLKTRQSVTEKRMQQVFRINFDELPLDWAVKVVRGDGKRKLAVFSDPDCPYCRKLETEMQKLENVTIYNFLFPLEGLHPQAKAKAISIWCSEDRSKAWLDLMIRNQEPTAKGDCENPVQKTIELGQKLRVNGTPGIIFANGRLVPGALPIAAIEKALEEADKAGKDDKKEEKKDEKKGS